MKHLKLIAPLLLTCALARGQQVTEADYLGEFDGTLAPVKIHGQEQFLHSAGTVLIDKLENISLYGVVVGVKHNAYGAISTTGKVIAPFKFDEVTVENNKDDMYPAQSYCFVTVKLNGKCGAIDTLGNIICPIEYDDVTSLHPHLFKIRKAGRWGWGEIKTGRILQAPVYDDVDRSYVMDNVVEITKGTHKGLAREDGTVLVPPSYKNFEALRFENASFFVYEEDNGKLGIMDSNGKAITKAIYDKCERGLSTGTFMVAVKDQWGLADSTGKELLPPEYEAIKAYGSAAIVSRNGKEGIINEAGKLIVPVEYNEIHAYNNTNGEAAQTTIISGNQHIFKMPGWFTARKNNRWNLFDANGKPLLSQACSNIHIVSNSKPVIEIQLADGETALPQIAGALVLPFIEGDLLDEYGPGYPYDSTNAGPVKANYLALSRNGKFGLYNTTTGKEILPTAYNRIEWQNSSLLLVSQGEDSTGMADATGRMIRKMKQDGFYTAVDTNRIVELNYLNDGNPQTTLSDLAGNLLYTGTHWQFKSDRYSRLLVPEKERRAHISYSDGLLKLWGEPRANVFLDTNGKEVVFKDYAFVGDFWHGLAVATKAINSKEYYGIINRKGDVVYPITADDMSAFEDNLITVVKDKLQGLIRMDGSIFIPLKYEQIDRFYQLPYYKVQSGERYGVIDTGGKLVIPVVYNTINYLEDGRLFEVVKDGKSGLLALDGKPVIPVKYDELQISRGYEKNIFPVLVKENKWYFYLDAQGKQLPYRSTKRKGYDD
ncbi:WG repeat-containing protein [Chitinophaga sp. 212800010-3]|uniref:WG repeat-containing protein n=1 Tax=unclassified Chitinophaga TaxID=2619133 RepID=UPI002DF6BD45|nr:WG containing repeat-containing protein [Chitinophaga sp. 212800010-3]